MAKRGRPAKIKKELVAQNVEQKDKELVILEKGLKKVEELNNMLAELTVDEYARVRNFISSKLDFSMSYAKPTKK